MKIKAREDLVIAEAKTILEKRMRQLGGAIKNIQDLTAYLQLEYAVLESEQFGCMFLDKNYKLINHNKMFRGTFSVCPTYPREIAREALLQNAVFVILVHNHPSNDPVASYSDVETTLQLQNILAKLDICLFDHVIVAGQQIYSMRGNGDIR